MKKDSAVEWLHYVSKQRELDKFDFEQAKEMEKLENNKYICIKCKCKIDEEMHKVSDSKK
jgi:hypothetical protein